MNAIKTKADAEHAIAQVAQLIEQLRGVIEQETQLVNAGQVRKAVPLGVAKSELATKLFAAGEVLKRNARFLKQAAPASIAALRGLQDAFSIVLKKNMSVLSTAHAVTEGIVRRLSADLARKASPSVYGATGRAIAPNPKHGKPLAVSRVL